MKKNMTMKELRQLALKKGRRIIKAKPEVIPEHIENDYNYLLQQKTREKLGIWLD